ncbi:MAG: hypothetical protein GY862_05625 [Gammaproteobacteria bacterium]|nr:hypothetical protein [Gammaproteobacteria bacterium]
MRISSKKLTFMMAFAAMLLTGAWASAADQGLFSPPGLPKPTQQASESQKCVEPVEVMRRDHMNLLLHKRVKTMRDGIRTKTHSLKECIACHVTPGADGRLPDIKSPKHFCNGCHVYAAVSTIDCFQCHANRPEEETASTSITATEAARLVQTETRGTQP